jgi:hypothetical protein
MSRLRLPSGIIQPLQATVFRFALALEMRDKADPVSNRGMVQPGGTKFACPVPGYSLTARLTNQRLFLRSFR